MAATPATTTPPEPQRLEEVVVTAQRRTERLATVPISVAAYSAKELERSQIHNIQDLSNNTPAVTFTATPYGGQDILLSIRGVAPGGVLPNVDTAVGVYLDGVYFARPEGSNFALVDIASAEVLRGPQGTLFGRNTIGGALNITTNEPRDAYGGSLSLGAGNYGMFTANGVVNMPLVPEKLDARIVFNHASHNGYGKAVNLDAPLSDQNDNYVRASLKAKPTANLTIRLTGDYYRGAEHSALWVLNYLDPTIASAGTVSLLAPYVAGPGTRSITADFNPKRTSNIYDVNGTITDDLGWATLKSITAYRRLDFHSPSDSDGTKVQLLDYDFSLTGSQVSEELQLYGTQAGGRFNWFSGLYYFQEHITNDLTVLQPANVIFNNIVPKNTSKSVFAQVSYEFLPKMRVTLGARYVEDEREISYPATRASLTTTPLPAGVACPLIAAGLNQVPNGCNYTPAPVHFHYVPWTAGLEYELNGSGVIYAKVSRGFRSGGFQQPGGSAAAYYTPFQPENVISEEIGAKASLLDGRLFLDGAVYHTAYNRIQQNDVQISSTGAPIIRVFNAGEAKIYGGELSATILIQKLRLNGAVGLIDPQFVSGPYKGSPVPTVAKTTWSVRADYPLELSAGVLNLHVDYSYKSKVYFLNTINPATGRSYTPAQIASFTQGAYGLLNAQVSYTPANSNLTVSLWGKNLGNKYYAGRAGSTFTAGFNTIAIGEPRTYGVTLTIRFGES